MGDPIRQKKKYSTPRHPWEGGRIESENVLVKEYGLKNKGEIWKASTVLRKMKQQARTLISLDTEQARKEEELLIARLVSIGLISSKASVDDVLGIDLKKLLDRRLQTQVFKRGLGRTPKQARQFIVHKHILVGDKIVNKPSYMVLINEESKVSFDPLSLLSKVDHPERFVEKPKAKAVGLTEKEKESAVAKEKEITKPEEQPKEVVKEAPKEKVVEEKK